MDALSKMTVTASRALYIKLGEANRWAKLALETDTLRFGFHDVPHETALAARKADDFRQVRDFYTQDVGPGTATRYSNEVREFYTAGADVLWITFVAGRMWWCFANAEVFPTSANPEQQGSRYRKAVNSWCDSDLRGRTLWVNGLRGSLTTTAGFRGTICRVKEFDYLLRRLNGEETEATRRVREAREQLIAALVPLIRALHWRDFELLVELVMSQGGWRRVSATGGAQQTIDIELELPLTGDRALVQVKSMLAPSDAREVASRLRDAAQGARAFLVYHSSPSSTLAMDEEGIVLIGPDALAERVVDSGLTTWLMAKVG
jgi:hypothetical protein